MQEDLELVAMCGLPPFVDEMVDVFIDEGIVFVGVPRLFTRPLRLTAPEGFTLLAAGRAAMELPGADPSGPLGRGLDKLAVAARSESGSSGRSRRRCDRCRRRSRPARVSPTIWPRRLRRAGSWSISTTRRRETRSSDRIIVPRHVFVDARQLVRHWPTTIGPGSAAPSASIASRSVGPTGSARGSDDAGEAPDRFFVDADVPRAVLRLGPSARWVVEEYPVDDVTERRNGRWIEVRLPVSSERWLAKLLIRLGPNAVLDGTGRDDRGATRPPVCSLGYGET